MNGNFTQNITDPAHDQMILDDIINTSSDASDELKIPNKNNSINSKLAYVGSKVSTKEDSIKDISKELKQTRILLAESEPEILLLFKTYLDSLGIESVTVDDGDTAVETFLQSKNMGKHYDAVVIDTHLKGTLGLEAAKKIRENDHSQRIILLTTTLKEQLSKEKLQSTAIEERDILVKPFKLSNLRQLLLTQ
ncbi:MAG: response regulator [Thermoproteota archaeon]|nr:response regulator [Thermoproteota archaeon]